MNVHAGSRRDTFADEIIESGASLVFARSAFGYGHEPERAVVDATTLGRTVLQAGPAAAVLLPPHAAISKVQATSSATRAAR